jgi:hypothetical protein
LPGAALFHILDDGDGECTLEDFCVTVHGFKRLLHAAQMFDSMLQVSDASTTHLYMFLLVPWSFLNAPRIAKQCCFKMAVGMSNTLRCTFFFRICFLVQMMGKYGMIYCFYYACFPSFMFDFVVFAFVVVVVAVVAPLVETVVVAVAVVVVVVGVVVVVVVVGVVVGVVALSPALLPVQRTSLVSHIPSGILT